MNSIDFKQVFKGNTNTLKGDVFEYPSTNVAEIERWIVTLPPQTCGEWHIHLVPEFFYVVTGVLYVVNELQDKSLSVTTYNKSDHGISDCNVPQFIWNPHKSNTVRVVAIYFGGQDIQPTKKLGERPCNELLNNLLATPISVNNFTEIENHAKDRP